MRLPVFGSEEASTGLPAALKVAGISVDINGFAPGPGTLAEIQNGGVTAGLAGDNLVSSWEVIDEAARLVTGQALTGAEANDQLVLQMVTGSDLAGDQSKGFTAYPDTPQRFTTLWSAAK